ncbi:MAG TPA: LysM peptidoglycan-binding domain-containing protein [Puia sp.]|nr:LysM peptidoglycan-binding domain-containing protein [Puia sp.]
MKTVRSQSDELIIQGQTGHLYLQHTVIAKENWYSIGRLYNLSPAVLAPYNKLTLKQPLSIGQQLQIPLTAVNFSQNGQKAAGESLVPLYHVIQEKEWMYRISVNHNKVPVTSLEKWNNINKDQVRAGMHIIVGYLKVKTALSALANRTGGNVVVTGTPGSVKPAANADAGVPTGVAPVEKTVASHVPPTSNAGDGGKQTTAAGKSTYKQMDSAARPAEKPADRPAETASGKSFNGGFFKNDFTDGAKSAEGAAGIFKSSSGWQDGKYYALMNNVPVGTIVRVTVASSGKSVYAKVLGQLPDMKESAGLTIRISNAAAGELGEGEGRFNVSVRY